MGNFTLLTEEQIFGVKQLKVFKKNQLDIFKKIGVKASATDYAILLGANVSYVGEEKLENRTGSYWMHSDHGNDDAKMVFFDGKPNQTHVLLRIAAIRPVVPVSSIILDHKECIRNQNGILEIKYGNYPQMAVNKEMQKKLENVFQGNGLKRTGCKFTVDTRKWDEFLSNFLPRDILEYEYQGKRYVRVKANPFLGKGQLLNGEYYQDGDYVWIEVSPVKWFIDEKSGLMMSEKLLFSGIQFHHDRDYIGNFSGTDMKRYLDRYFAPELIGETFIREEILENKKDKIQAILNQIDKAKKRLEKEKEKLLEGSRYFQDQNSEKIKQLKK